jgi:signal transduction histidine kinase/putative methionine-R-sulfoxide reductase with GAF domain
MPSAHVHFTNGITESRIQGSLEELTQIGNAINAINSSNQFDLQQILTRIAQCSSKIIAGASANFFVYIPQSENFVIPLQDSEGYLVHSPREVQHPWIEMRALQQHRRVISNEEVDPDNGIPIVENVEICYPLEILDQIIGVFYFHSGKKCCPDKLEIAIIDNFVNMALLAISQAQKLTRFQRDLNRKSDELDLLRKAGLAISSRMRLNETLEVILQMAMEVTGAHYGIFRLVDRSGQNLVTRVIAGEGLTGPKVEVLPIAAKSIMSWVASNRKPVCISDLSIVPWKELYYPLDVSIEMRSELAVPLIGSNGKLEGVLNLESPRVGAFTEQDSYLLQSLATQAIIAIQEVRLLDTLQEVAQQLLTQPRQIMLDGLVELASDLLNCDSGAIWLVKDGRLALQSSYGNYHFPGLLMINESLPEKIFSARKAIAGYDFVSPVDLLVNSKPVRVLAVPMIADDGSDPLGILGVYSEPSEVVQFIESDWNKKVLTCLAYYASLAVLNAIHQEELNFAQEQRAVAETFAAVGDVAANLLHQLNNKVGTIPVRIQGIREKCREIVADNIYLRRNLQEIEKSASEAMASVRENLGNLRPISLSRVRVVDLVQNALANIHFPVSIQVIVDGLELLPLVNAGNSLTLVFTNLLENAVDAMGGKGLLKIFGTSNSQWVQVTVMDTGPGIPISLQERIFELNYSGRSGMPGGKLGFGLWWAKTLMVRFGGSISVESDGEHGASFILRLPRLEE